MKIIKIHILFLALSLTTVISSGQTYIISGNENEVLIKGTSNLHDWQMVVSESSCEANFNIDGNQLKSIMKVDFRCNPYDIKSDHALMDKKTYSALKTDVFPEIMFSFLSNNSFREVSGEYKSDLRGNLIIAGVSREVIVPVTATVSNSNTIKVEGSIELNMRDFNITPPTALLGTLKTGDKVSVHYSLNLARKTQLSSR